MLELNELDVVKCRKVDYLPTHFVKIKINDHDYFDSDIEDWIKTKLNHRYAVLVVPVTDTQGRLKYSAFAAFESQKELTFFMLACPFLRR